MPLCGMQLNLAVCLATTYQQGRTGNLASARHQGLRGGILDALLDLRFTSDDDRSYT